MTVDVLFVGAGDLAQRCHGALAGEGLGMLGLCRHPEARAPADLPLVAADYTRSGGLAQLEEIAPRVLVVVFKPTSRDVAGYATGYRDPVRELLAGLGSHRPERILFISSTRVYAERDGGWVDEAAPTTRDDAAGALIAEAESLLSLSGLPATTLRCAGLYGGADGYLQRRVASGNLAPAQPVHYSNRIHRDDAAAFMAFLIVRALAGMPLEACYNVVDDEPAPQHEVEAWIADRLGVPAEHRSEREPPAFRGKRCSNRLLRASGFQLRYPDFREGYSAVIADPRAG